MRQHTSARKGNVKPIQPCLDGARKSRKMGVSPIIATLLLIVIAVAGSIVAYAFVIGFIGGAQTQTFDVGMSVDTVSSSQSDIKLYIRNTGNAPITVDRCYVQGVNSLVMIPITPTISVSPGGVSAITLINNFSDGQYQFKIMSTSGAQCIINSYISGGTVSGGIAPVGVVAYFPINLTNNQATATAANFQQQLFINWSLYSSYVNSSLSNIIFFDNNGNQLYAWDENGTTNASNSLTTVWVNLGSNAIAANRNITINIGFYSLNYENRGPTSYWGMFPNATSVYAKYDNGNKVFIFYDNFNGTSISSAWNTTSATSDISVNNGLTVLSNPFPGYSFSLKNQYTGPMIVDAYMVGTTGDWIGASFSNLQTTSSSYTVTSGAVQWVYPPQGSDGIHDLYISGNHTAFAPNPVATTLQVVTLAVNSTTATSYQNYASPATVSGTITLTNYPGLPQVAFNAGDTQKTYWFRLRAYPPNNIMPSVSFGGLIVP